MSSQKLLEQPNLHINIAFSIEIGTYLVNVAADANRAWTIGFPKWTFVFHSRSITSIGLEGMKEFCEILVALFKKDKNSALYAKQLLDYCSDGMLAGTEPVKILNYAYAELAWYEEYSKDLEI